MRSPPLPLPREAAGEAGNCVSSALRDHIPSLAHSSSPGIAERLPLAACAAHGALREEQSENDIRSKERATCLYSNRDALGFRGIKASAAAFTPSVQVDDVAVTAFGLRFKKASTFFFF